MAEAGQKYRKKQAVLCILVFVCLAVAFLSSSALVTVGVVMAAIAICFLAARMEPERGPEEHHHH